MILNGIIVGVTECVNDFVRQSGSAFGLGFVAWTGRRLVCAAGWQFALGLADRD